MDNFFDMFLDGLTSVYGWLEDIPTPLSGVSLFDFMLSMLVISIVVPIVITLASNNLSSDINASRRERRYKDVNNEK